MKKKLFGVRVIALITFIMSLQSIVCASFSGQWEGTGQAKDTTGWSSPCEKISYTFVHTTNTLNVDGGEVKCGDFEATFDTATLRIEGDKLFYEDLEVGTITSDLLHVVFQDDLISLSYSFSIKNNTLIEYRQHEVYDDSDISVEGRLMKLADPKETI